MNGYDGDWTGLHATGSYDDWSGVGTALTDEDGDGIYTGTISLAPGTYEYKYVIGGWGGPESGADHGGACDFNPNDDWNNYGFEVGSEDVVLPAYVFGQGCALEIEDQGLLRHFEPPVGILYLRIVPLIL